MLLNSIGKDLYIQVLEPGLTALTNAKFPASGSFIDVSRFERFAFLVGLDVIADALDFKVQQATAVNGTPKDITGAADTDSAGTDDQKWIVIEVQTRKLDINNDYRYVTLDVSGVSGTDNACIVFIGVPTKRPVTQHADFLDHVIVAG
jgi:hypothetical protein